MHCKNIVLSSLKESLISIWKSKLLFILLFFLQIAFFIIFAITSYHYQTKIIENANNIFNYLNNQQLSEADVTERLLHGKNVLGDDPLSISRNFNSIVKNFRIYLVYVFVFIIVFMSTSWSITSRIVNKINFKQLTSNFLKMFVVLMFYLGLVFSFFYSLLNISFTEIAVENAKFLTKYLIFMIFSVILVYFMFVSISLLHNTGLKDIVQKTLSVGIKKIHYILAVYFINILLFISSIFLLLYFIEKNLFILFISIVLMVFSFVFGRIFMVNVIEKLDWE